MFVDEDSTNIQQASSVNDGGGDDFQQQLQQQQQQQRRSSSQGANDPNYHRIPLPASTVTPVTPFSSDISEGDDLNNAKDAEAQKRLKTAQERRLKRIMVDYDEELDSRPWKEVLMEFLYGARSTFFQTEVYLRISLNDAGKRKGSFCLGFFSIMLVVLLCAILLSVLTHLQLVFMRLAESENGKIDLLVQPGGQFEMANSLNYSVFLDMFPTGVASYHSARVVFDSMSAFPAWGSPSNGCGAYADNITALWYPSSNLSAPDLVRNCVAGTRDCIEAHCSGVRSLPSTFVLLDAQREVRMGLGSGEWPTEPLGYGEAIVTRGIANELSLEIGSTLPIFGDVSYQLMEAYNTAGMADLGVAATGSSLLPYTSWPIATFNLTVRYIVSGGDEKFETDLSSIIVANFGDALSLTAQSLSPSLPDAQRAIFAGVSPNVCASRVYINLPPGNERESVYTHRDFSDIQRDLMQFSSVIFGVIGFNQVNIDTPILTYLDSVRFFSLFLGLIVSLILLALAFLSIVLIYSLLTVNIQGRTFELGIQRMLGFTKQNLTGLVFTNAMLFAIPAWGVGLAVGFGLYVLLRSTLSSALGVDIPLALSPDAVGFATLAGIGIPLVASIAPVMDVLTLSLPEALNSDRSKMTAVIYNIRGRKTGYVSFTMILLGLCFTAYGFVIYYLFPTALIDFNISLLFYIFFGILIAMLGGLVLLSINFERVVETAMCWIFLFWEQSSVFHLISKNLVAHRPRNRKTTLMYALSLGFILFITVAFNIQLTSIEYSSLMTLGGDARYQGSLQWEEFLVFDQLLHRGSIAPRVSRVTYLGNSILRILSITNISISSIGRYRTNTASMIAIPPNFYDVLDDNYLIIGSAAPSPYSLSESLYTIKGSSQVIMATSDKKSLDLQSFDDPFLLNVATVNPFTGNNWTQTRTVTSPYAWFDASPVVPMASLPQAVGRNVLMSFPSTIGRSGGAFRSIRDNRIGSFVMNVAESNLDNVTAELSQVRLRFSSDVSLTNIYSTKSTLSTATTIVNLFFIFTQIMAMVICFFALLSSMSTNVLEQSKEIGILRSIGMHKFPIYRLYTWEAFVLVISASLLGVIVGTVVAYSMMLQNSLLTQVPLKFQFPVFQLVTVLVVSMICSVLASYGPIAYLLNLPSITHILRRVM
ncbi:FtsX-like permease family protein, putative [Bodo saltans]|uniref:FtsX-like permease family protein, putative n=1 Tax=Bodo saltans TaxID=75058 RepID=A0A0S4J7F0_BODSA|nr:FtsX-like permease family protein, putative [Bodo saltans]|eukprot:CUG86219.1 FtsX-like permease family protein, putative [Bodo saltans]